MVPILSRHGQKKVRDSVIGRRGHIEHIFVFLLMALFSDVQGKVVSFVQNNNVGKLGSSGTADGYRVQSLATPFSAATILNEHILNRQKDYMAPHCAEAGHRYSGSGASQVPTKNYYAGKGLCIEFVDIPCSAIDTEKNDQQKNISSGVFFCRMAPLDFEGAQELKHTHTIGTKLGVGETLTPPPLS